MKAKREFFSENSSPARDRTERKIIPKGESEVQFEEMINPDSPSFPVSPFSVPALIEGSARGGEAPKTTERRQLSKTPARNGKL